MNLPKVNLSSQPVSSTEEKNGWLAGLLTETWQHLPGIPGRALVAEVAATLDGIPPEEFARLLMARRAKARGFGLALDLARELRQRSEVEAAERQRAAAAENDRRIQACVDILADPEVTAEERADIEQYLAELRGPPKKGPVSAGNFGTGGKCAAGT